MIRNVTMTTVLFVAIGCEARAALVTVNDFDNILFWAGSGTNQAALVIQFPTTVGTGTATVVPTSIAWGYRWDGSATFADMLFSLAGGIASISSPPPEPPLPQPGSDPNLAVDLGFFNGLGWYIDSITYDQSGLGAGWSPVVRVIAPYDFDTGEYAAQYQLDNADGVWTGAPLDFSGSGISGTALVDGGWYGFVQADGLDSTFAFTQPVSAVPEPSSLVLAACGAAAWIAWRRRARVA